MDARLQEQIDSLQAKGESMTDFERVKLGRLTFAIEDEKSRDSASRRVGELLCKPTETRAARLPLTIANPVGEMRLARSGPLEPITPAIRR